MKTYVGNNCVVDLLPFEKTCKTLVEEKIALHEREDKDEAFLCGDLGDIISKYNYWVVKLPRVVPFYAVKCNDDHAVLKVLSDLGASFACASKAEIEKVLKLGVQPNCIIYAHPCKQKSNMRYAANCYVSLMTFDNEGELHKVKDIYPGAKLVLRILPPNNFKVQCEPGMKFGCQPSEAHLLLQAARNLGLDVVGVSFHVDSGCQEARAFEVAIQQARQVFDIGQDLGFNMNLLDIGGGFPGLRSAPISFDEIVEVLNEALELHFPSDEGVRIIAEPGHYMVASAFTLGVNIIGKRVIASDQHGESTTHQNLLPGSLMETKTRFDCNQKYVQSLKLAIQEKIAQGHELEMQKKLAESLDLEMQQRIAETGFVISGKKHSFSCQYCAFDLTFDNVIAGCDLWTMHHKHCKYLLIQEPDEQRQPRDDNQAVPTRTLMEPQPTQSGSTCEDGEPRVLSSEPAIKYQYQINDGVYGSFSYLLYDDAHVEVSLPGEPEMDHTYECSLCGPTGDSLDCILEKTCLPELNIGDWLYFINMGAYTMAATSTFKGTPPPIRYYYCLAELWYEVYAEQQRKEKASIRQMPKHLKPVHTLQEAKATHDFKNLLDTSNGTVFNDVEQ